MREDEKVDDDIVDKSSIIASLESSSSSDSSHNIYGMSVIPAQYKQQRTFKNYIKAQLH